MKQMGIVSGLLVVVCVLNTAAGDWPEFRGVRGDGRVGGAPQLPLTWSETEHILWKTEIPNVGWSTPVGMNGQLWLTSAAEDGSDYFVYCVDAESGKIVFDQKLFHCDEPEPLGNSVNCYASPTAALEPGRVYVHFGSYGTACLDTQSKKVLWKRNDLPCRHYRGPGSSAILHDNLLILTFDGVDQQYVTALDKKTGKTVWRTDRDVDWKDLDDNGKPKREGDFRKAYASPIVITVAGKQQLICPASASIFAYDVLTGHEIWKVVHTGHSASVSPVFSQGLVLATTGNRTVELLGIRPDGKGDVSKSHVDWRFGGKDVPTTPSPVATDELVFMVSNRGTLTCIDVKTGEPFGASGQAETILLRRFSWVTAYISAPQKGKLRWFVQAGPSSCWLKMNWMKGLWLHQRCWAIR